MAKIIKTIFIIAISVASSTATTVVLMLRYTKPLENSTAHNSTSTFQREYPEQSSIASVEKIVEPFIQRQEQDAETTDSAQSQPEATRYFDYALLSRDMDAFSATVSRFNGMLSREIKKLKEGSTSEDNTSP